MGGAGWGWDSQYTFFGSRKGVKIVLATKNAVPENAASFVICPDARQDDSGSVLGETGAL